MSRIREPKPGEVLGTSYPRYRLLCELVGATRESVSLVFGRLSGEGLVERKGTSLIVTPPVQLAERLELNAMENEIPFPAFAEGQQTALQ